MTSSAWSWRPRQRARVRPARGMRAGCTSPGIHLSAADIQNMQSPASAAQAACRSGSRESGYARSGLQRADVQEGECRIPAPAGPEPEAADLGRAELAGREDLQMGRVNRAARGGREVADVGELEARVRGLAGLQRHRD